MNRADALFDELTALQADKRLPPVGRWHPERQGRIDIRIAADGTWYHEGEPIRRKPLVRLFSTILRKDADGFCLVTPAERLLIDVEDAPFVTTDLKVKGSGRSQQLLFVTNVDDYVLADAEHPIRVEGLPDHPRPYLHVREGLDALIGRSDYYRLVDLCEPLDDGYWIRSAGSRFRLG
ncbi:MAG: DUF1285 domain-containing protein [Pseudomonadales bacterium]